MIEPQRAASLQTSYSVSRNAKSLVTIGTYTAAIWDEPNRKPECTDKHHEVKGYTCEKILLLQVNELRVRNDGIHLSTS